jgi:hypothetical protein
VNANRAEEAQNPESRTSRLALAALVVPGCDCHGFRGKAISMADRKERRLAGSGTRFIGIGVPPLLIGIALAILLDGTARGIGAAIAVLGTIPVVVGITLLLSASVEEGSRRRKPFA